MYAATYWTLFRKSDIKQQISLQNILPIDVNPFSHAFRFSYFFVI